MHKCFSVFQYTEKLWCLSILDLGLEVLAWGVNTEARMFRIYIASHKEPNMAKVTKLQKLFILTQSSGETFTQWFFYCMLVLSASMRKIAPAWAPCLQSAKTHSHPFATGIWWEQLTFLLFSLIELLREKNCNILGREFKFYFSW